MKVPHDRVVPLSHSFPEVATWLHSRGIVTLTTRAGTIFQAVTKVGEIQPIIKFMQGEKEYGRTRACCWGHSTNCAGTWIGMYCKALDKAVGLHSTLDKTAAATGVQSAADSPPATLPSVARPRRADNNETTSVGGTIGIMDDSAKLIAALSQVSWQDWFAQHWVEHRDRDWRWIIEHWVASSTFRAFHYMPEPPSTVFREWAYNALFGGGAFERLCSIKSASDYDHWFEDLATDLRKSWIERMGATKAMGFGHSMKLPGLVMKGICCSPSLPRPVFDRVVYFLHVPLDSFSIRAIRFYVPSSGLAQQIGSIPSSAMMGFVKTPQMYYAFQQCIRQVAKEAGVPPMAFDILAWDAAHE